MGGHRRRAPFFLVVASLLGGVLAGPGQPRPAAAAPAAPAAAAPAAPAAPAAAAPGDPVPIAVSASAANGEGRIEAPGRRCADGGTGAYWNYDYDAALPAGAGTGGFGTTLPATLALHLALHSDEVRYPNTGPALPPTPAAEAFLQGEDSFAVLANDRGTVKVRLRSGSCDSPSLQFDGGTATGAGTWSVDSGQGAFRDVTGSGTFSLAADVDPGADNPFDLQLQGSLAVPQPALSIRILGTFWGSLGLDYVSRRVTVLYEIKNSGTGDAFDASLLAAIPGTTGASFVDGELGPLGDLGPGETEVRAVRYQLGLLQPCNLVILNCHFNANLKVQWSDALDVVSTPLRGATAHAPTLPPPL